MKGWSGAWNTAEVPVSLRGVRIIQVRRTGKGCLSYLIAAGGVATVIDASVGIGVYTQIADGLGCRIARIVETHVHADHLSRARELARTAGAALMVPDQRRLSFPHIPVTDNDEIPIGADVPLSALRTPGHTGESTCYSLGGELLFTGDTLFLDSIGRPDLEAGAAEAKTRARMAYASLRRILSLPAGTIILPGHSSAPVPFDQRPLLAPLGEVQARTALLRASEESFVAEVVARIPPLPPNVARILASNESGLTPEGSPEELEAGANRCAIA
jgi:glyoxylase-like metal-dependent hydrolase (beta-lactamase superfamily II)